MKSEERCNTCGHLQRFHQSRYSLRSYDQGKMRCTICAGRKVVVASDVSALHRVQWLTPTSPQAQ